MKKQGIIAGAILIGCVSLLKAQSIEIYDFGKTKSYKNGDTIEVLVSAYDTKMENILVAPKNISDGDISVNAKQTVLNRVGENEYAFCWGSCYEDNFEETMVGDPDMAVSVASNSFCDEVCIFDFTAKSKGTTYVRYTFFNQNNSDDSACIILKYNDDHVAVPSVATTGMKMSAYPNPCNDMAQIHWESKSVEPMHLKVCNILGVCLFEQEVTGKNSIEIPVSDWNNGLYFYSLSNGSEVYCTQKLIVKH